MFPGTPLFGSPVRSHHPPFSNWETQKSLQNYRLIFDSCVERPKRACDRSNKQETLVGVSGSWLLLIKRCSAKLSLQSNQTKVNDFVTRVANEKRHLRSSRRLSWSSRTGWQAVSTTIFEWHWNFATGVSNKKRCLRSSQRQPWSSRMGWQTVSTTIFEWLLNLWLKMWTNYRLVPADNLLEGRTNQMIFFNQTQCSKTQSKFPSMMQAQLLSNQCEMRREDPVSCQCWIRLFTTINSQHYNWTKVWWPNQDAWKKILLCKR